MAYDKVLIDSDGEEYPYSELITDDGYQYRISVVFRDKEGELSVIADGIDLRFDDGTWLDFNIAPKKLFPGQYSLSEEDLKNLIGLLGSDQGKQKLKIYSKEQFKQIYTAYEEHLKSVDIEQAADGNADEHV
jgi:hypothetical protein